MFDRDFLTVALLILCVWISLMLSFLLVAKIIVPLGSQAETIKELVFFGVLKVFITVLLIFSVFLAWYFLITSIFKSKPRKLASRE